MLTHLSDPSNTAGLSPATSDAVHDLSQCSSPRGVTPQVVIDLAGAVVVRPARANQSQTSTQRIQQVALLHSVVLVIDLDSVEPVVEGQRLDHIRGQDILVLTAPGMGENCHSPRTPDEFDRPRQIGGVAADVGGPVVVQEADERLFPIGDVALGDHGVGDMRTSDGRGSDCLRENVGFSQRIPQVGELLRHCGQPALPTVADLSELSIQIRIVDAGTVSQQVH